MDLRKELKAFWTEEDGVGVIEVVLILFKKQINDLLNNVFKEINKQSKEVY